MSLVDMTFIHNSGFIKHVCSKIPKLEIFTVGTMRVTNQSKHEQPSWLNWAV